LSGLIGFEARKYRAGITSQCMKSDGSAKKKLRLNPEREFSRRLS
jgi:hypothetical protein